jgi:enoyl-CoA hydratase
MREVLSPIGEQFANTFAACSPPNLPPSMFHARTGVNREQHGVVSTSDYVNYRHLRFERVGYVLVVTIAHAVSPMNAVDEELHAELARLMADLRRESTARAIVLTGADAGTATAFCAGGDFAWFPQLRTVAALEHLRRDAKAIIWDLLEVSVPIICALNGHAMGLGASIALLCDSIVMSTSARIGDPHIRVGLVAGDGGTAIWPLAIGPALAKRYLLTGDQLDADTCLRLGLVTDLAAPDELMPTAMALATKMASMPPLAVQYTKAAVNQQVKQALLASFDIAAQSELVTFLSADHVEAVSAITEKRQPTYKGH